MGNRRKRIVVLCIVILLITSGCILYFSINKSILRFSAVFDYSYLVENGIAKLDPNPDSQEAYSKYTTFFSEHVEADAVYFDLRENGDLFILRGRPRLDFDLREFPYIPFIKKIKITKLSEQELNDAVENAEIIIQAPEKPERVFINMNKLNVPSFSPNKHLYYNNVYIRETVLYETFSDDTFVYSYNGMGEEEKYKTCMNRLFYLLANSAHNDWAYNDLLIE